MADCCSYHPKYHAVSLAHTVDHRHCKREQEYHQHARKVDDCRNPHILKYIFCVIICNRSCGKIIKDGSNGKIDKVFVFDQCLNGFFHCLVFL